MLSLSAADLERLANAQQTLLSPLAHPTITHWRHEVHRLLKELVDADMAASILPLAGTPLVYSNEIGPSEMAQYPATVEPLSARVSVWQKAGPLGVFDRQMLWVPYLKEHYRSEYYDDYALTILQSHHVVGLAMTVSSADDATGASQIILVRNRPEAPPFGDRELALLRLVQPAYATGVETCIRVGEHRSALARVLDTVSEGLLVCDGRGAVVHANAALEALLRADAERGRLYDAARRIADALAARGLAERRLIEPERSTIRTTEATYRMRGNYLAEDAFEAGVAILVAVERATPVIPAAEDIRRHFTLTAKEAAVARLLAEGKPNDAIADTLYISPHTARRHTESVLKKLGAASRAEVGPLLLRLDRVPS